MGKEELLDALTTLQDEASTEGIAAQLPVVLEALADIQRKRWRFLEDSCSVVLRQIWSLVINDEILESVESDKRLTITQAVELSLQFIEPLLQPIADAEDDNQESCYQISSNLDVGGLRTRLVSDILASGVEVHVIVATLRFREELGACRRSLLPSFESDSESESELDSEDEDSDETSGEFDAEDTRWIAQKLAQVWGLTRFQYFLQTSGQEYSFSAWSYRGVGNFIHALLGNAQLSASALSPVVSPFSWLFHVAAYAHYMIHSEDLKERVRGLEELKAAASYCPNGKFTLQSGAKDALKSTQQSFQEHVASFRQRDWLSPLIQVITNAMVSFPEAADRSATLAVLKELIYKLDAGDRFQLLRPLILKCPYGNVGAVLVDFVRGDTVQAWSSLETNARSPFTTPVISTLLHDILLQTAERDLVQHADLVASCSSLLRFLHIRDKDDVTGIKTNDRIGDVIVRIKKRLDVKNEETGSLNDSVHLMILDAALGSTLELYN